MADYTTEFTGKQIIRAVYTNESHDTIKVEYCTGGTHPDGTPTITPMYVPADVNSYMTKALFAEGYDFERVQKETVIHNQQQAMAWRKIVKAEAALEINKVKAEYQQKYEDLIANAPTLGSNIFQYVMDNNTNEEVLFRTKLAAFEAPEVKSTTDKSLKQKIRTSKSLLDLFAVLSIIYATT